MIRDASPKSLRLTVAVAVTAGTGARPVWGFELAAGQGLVAGQDECAAGHEHVA